MPNCCRVVHRVMGVYHSRYCPTYPNTKVGGEHLLDNARAGNLRSEISKHAERVARSHDWNHCQRTDCAECRYVDSWLDRDDDGAAL
jgi:hypothetical protein